jgi:hypothetical protein
MNKKHRLINCIKQDLHEIVSKTTKLTAIELRDKCYRFRKNYGADPDVEDIIFILTDIINGDKDENL